MCMLVHLAYNQKLRKRHGKESIELDEELGFEEASIIEDLMGISSRKSSGPD